MTPQNPGFSGYNLDRAVHLRGDAAALGALVRQPQTRWLHMDGFDPLPGTDGTLRWDGPPADDPQGSGILLGLREGVAHCVALQDLEADMPLFRSPRVMELLAVLNASDMAIFGTVRSLLAWHGQHRFCGRCGAPTRLHRAGWGRQCSNCAREHFPRVDPVVIMVATHGGRALVGRQAAWPQGRYSALAGFVEPGETMEEAVARELFEEAGVRATRVRYVTSQPWPFPAQLMLACVAEVDSDALQIDTRELERALWVTPAQVLQALDGEECAPFLAPPSYAVAHGLLRHWAMGASLTPGFS